MFSNLTCTGHTYSYSPKPFPLPSAADLGETLCSLNFGSRVKGIEYGPARKQTDFSELLKYKHLAKKSKHDEKEAKKLQDNVQSLQLRLSAIEHICRNLQEKFMQMEDLS
ncbi:kinesin-like protein KIN-14S [Spinacia oleracea]|uniref:Kinesin-like protein KIN-14S n=1 Tax=Spinacia oleracea TaxID=3562 RepID=A0ABM3RM60_SPIOL|nr:kinesin-like protein KIN-14S [Spinacia oleracea]